MRPVRALAIVFGLMIAASPLPVGGAPMPLSCDMAFYVGPLADGFDMDADGYDDQMLVSGTMSAGVDTTQWLNISLLDDMENVVDTQGGLLVSIDLNYSYYADFALFFDMLPAYAAGSYHASVRATDASQTDCGTAFSPTIELYPPGNYQPTLTPEATSLQGAPDTTLLFNVTATNDGNNPDTIDFFVSDMLGWDIYVDTGSASLEPGEAAVIGVYATVPPGAGSSEIDDIELQATSERDPSRFAVVSLQAISVPVEHGVAMSAQQPDASGPLGSDVTLTVTITNTGNAQDQFTLTTDSPPAGWSVDLEVTDVLLASSDSIDVGIFVTLPSTFDSEVSWEFGLTATAGDGLTSTLMPFVVSVDLPDFTLGEADINAQGLPAVGHTVQVLVTVHNVGAAASAPVAVTLSDGVQTGSAVAAMTPAGVAIVTIPWEPLAGHGTLTVTLDPSDAIPEVSEQNNTASRTYELNGAPTAALSAASTVAVGDALSFSGTGSTDPDNDTLEYNFDFGDGQGTGWTSNATATHAYSGKGEYNVTLKVRDPHGATSPAVGTVVNVTAAGTGGSAASGGFLPGFEGLPVVAALAAAGAIAAVGRSRRPAKR